MKLRVKLVILVTAILFVTALLLVPRIIEAKRAQAAALNNAPVANPVQSRKQEVLSGVSIRNDTSPPLREMKQKPIDGGPERPKLSHR
jgi:hypothetical protein